MLLQGTLAFEAHCALDVPRWRSAAKLGVSRAHRRKGFPMGLVMSSHTSPTVSVTSSPTISAATGATRRRSTGRPVTFSLARDARYPPSNGGVGRRLTETRPTL